MNMWDPGKTTASVIWIAPLFSTPVTLGSQTESSFKLPSAIATRNRWLYKSSEFCFATKNIFYPASNASQLPLIAAVFVFFRPTPYGSRQVVKQAGKLVADWQSQRINAMATSSYWQCAAKVELNKDQYIIHLLSPCEDTQPYNRCLCQGQPDLLQTVCHVSLLYSLLEEVFSLTPWWIIGDIWWGWYPAVPRWYVNRHLQF